MAVSSDVCWCRHVKQAHWGSGGCKHPGCGCQEYGPKDRPTDEEYRRFKEGELEAARAIMAGDRYCPDPSVHEPGRAVQDGLDPERLAEAGANVLDGRRIGSVRLYRNTITPDDWEAIAVEYARLALPSKPVIGEVDR